jgi:hypothetical protein
VITDHIDNEYLMPVWFYVDLGTGLVENQMLTGLQIMPNPFTSGLTAQFLIQSQTRVTAEVYNIHGERIASPVQDQFMKPGLQRVTWDGNGYSGESLPSGIYFLRITSGTEVLTGKALKE